MDRWLSTSLWQTEEIIHWRTGPDDARPNETFPDRNGHIKICNGSSAYPTGFKRRQTSHLFYLENSLSCRMKLWNLRQGIIGDHSSIGRMVTPHTRIATYDNCIIWSQESHVPLRSEEIESTTSLMVLIPIRMWCETRAHSREQDGPIWHFITKTQSLSGWQSQQREHHHATWRHFPQSNQLGSWNYNEKSLSQKIWTATWQMC